MELSDFIKGGGQKETKEKREGRRVITDKPATVTVESDGVKEETESLKQDIINDEYLWDMRCWAGFHNRAEVLAWVKRGCIPNNCGHAVYCIQELKKRGMNDEEITDIILKNNKIRYRFMKALCMKNADDCEHYRKTKDHSQCPCEQCDKGPSERGLEPMRSHQ